MQTRFWLAAFLFTFSAPPTYVVCAFFQMSGDPGLTNQQPNPSDPNFIDSNNVNMNGSAALPSIDEFGNAMNENMVSRSQTVLRMLSLINSLSYTIILNHYFWKSWTIFLTNYHRLSFSDVLAKVFCEWNQYIGARNRLFWIAVQR